MTVDRPKLIPNGNWIEDPADLLARSRIAVVIPAFDVADHITEVLTGMPDYVDHILVVDDGSSDKTGELAKKLAIRDSRILVLEHEVNRGVGSALVTGYRAALNLDVDIVVKMDGDGQMSPDRLPDLLLPLVSGTADCTKGNRFRDLRTLKRMPLIRRFGNVVLSFMCKLASGYWDLFDPTNGYLALRRQALERLSLDELASSFFFEISLLGQLYLADAVVKDIPMAARYGFERSKLRIPFVILEFPPKLVAMTLRRVLLRYFLYDFSVVSAYLVAGIPLLLFGVIFGSANWVLYSSQGVPAPTGTVMLAALPVILGFQLVLAAISQDVQSVPSEPISPPLLPLDN